MNTVTMKNVEFGAGVPKICVPICGKSKEDVLEQAKIILDTPADIIECRNVDFGISMIFYRV